jgi:hypothetical protein
VSNADLQGSEDGPPFPGNKTEPQDFVIVLAYTSTDGEVEEEFGKLVEDFKALYTFKQNMRAYALVEEAAKNVLAKVEKSSKEPSGRAVMVISYDQPDDIDEGYARLTRTADNVRDLFKNEKDVEVKIAIRDVADEVLGAFPRSDG